MAKPSEQARLQRSLTDGTSGTIEVRVGETGEHAFLYVSGPDSVGDVYAQLMRGDQYPHGECLVTFFGTPGVDIRIGDTERPTLWFGRSAIHLPWAELLKVADFLQLDIPQPALPAGQEVPR